MTAISIRVSRTQGLPPQTSGREVILAISPCSFIRFLSCWLFGHNTAHARAFDQTVKNDEKSFLILIGELVDVLIQPVQFRVVNVGFSVGGLPAGQLIETDIEDVGNPDHSVQDAVSRSRSPTGCRRAG
jgi:hypothetical protein